MNKKENIIISIISLLIICIIGFVIFLTTKSKYTYNYQNNNFKVQYDQNLLNISENETKTDVLFTSLEENSDSFVDIAIANYETENFDDILKYMSLIYTYGNTPEENGELKVTKELKDTIKIGHKKYEGSVYNYEFSRNEDYYIVYSKAFNLGNGKVFVVVECLNGNTTSQKSIAALSTIYNSVEIIN